MLGSLIGAGVGGVPRLPEGCPPAFDPRTRVLHGSSWRWRRTPLLSNER